MKRTLPFTFYFVYFAASAFTQPFIILYYQELGFSGLQISLLAAVIPLVVMISAPIWTGLADAKKLHKPIMSLTIVMSVLVTAIFPLAKSFALILPLAFLFAIFIAPIISFADSATLSMLAEKKEQYGRVRLGGTIGWGIFALLAGLVIETYGLRWAFWGFSSILIFTLFIVQKFSFSPPGEFNSFRNDVRQLLNDSRWLLFLPLAFVSGVAISIITTYLAPYMEELGMSRTIMGLALLITTVSELPVFFFSNYLLNRFRARGLLMLGLLMIGLRLLLYAAFNYQSGILVFQLLNGLTFPVFWVGAVSYANEISPQGLKATAQGLLGAMTFGIGAAVGVSVGGLLLGSLHGQATFLITGAFVLLSVGVISLMDRVEHLRQARRSF